MKEAELRKHTKCSICGRKLGETSMPLLFWVVKARRYGVDLAAVQRQTGLTMMLGGSASLAQIMGPDEGMAKPLTDEVALTICEECAYTGSCIGGRALQALEQEGLEQVT